MGPVFEASADALARRIPEGTLIALPPDYSLSPASLIAALIRHGVGSLHLFCLPVGGFLADLLIGAGRVATIETSAVSLGEFGPAPRFPAALRAGGLTLRDATCPALHTALQAAEKGVPFMPLRGLLGSDILAHRPDWRVIDNPFAEGSDPDPIVLIPAVRPDFALFHAPCADCEGNVWVGRRRELATLAHAARQSLVTVEHLLDHSLLGDETMAPGLITAPYITAIAPAPRGGAPLGLPGHYPPEPEVLAAYARAARTEEGFRAFLADFLASRAR